jgi:hypothetical protein
MKEPTIYMNGEDVPLTEVLKKMTDDWVDDGNYSAQTVIDLRDALKKYLKERESLLEDCKWLAALENAGVDNWEGIDYARELLNEDE